MSVLEPRFVRACRVEKVDRTPVWFMRQAGRYMKEYRDLRKKYEMLELCRNPELAAEVTMQPIRRFDLDAAIIFADILLLLPELGVKFAFVPGKGPRIEEPLRKPEDVDELHDTDPASTLDFVGHALQIVREELNPEIALIGFAGAPFTVASYMIEGGYSRQFLHTKRMMYRHTDAWHKLMETISSATAGYLRYQVESGAQALQLFDSWIGALAPEDYREYVLPHSRKIFQSLEDLKVPLIHFGTGTSGFLDLMVRAGGSVQSVDWRVPLGTAWKQVGFDRAIQGNLDPLAMMAPPETLVRKVDGILEEADGRPGHIFNLGHGFLPQTPIRSVEAVIERVHGKT